LLVTPGLYNTIQLLESIALHLDSFNGKPCIWEELVSCFLRLFSDWTADYEDHISCNNVRGDKALRAFSNFSSVFFEPFTRESWKARCRWWMHHHFSQKAYMSGTLTGSCLFLFLKFMLLKFRLDIETVISIMMGFYMLNAGVYRLITLTPM
jgi:hypothetical protein